MQVTTEQGDGCVRCGRCGLTASEPKRLRDVCQDGPVNYYGEPGEASAGWAWESTWQGMERRIKRSRWTPEQDSLLIRLFREGKSWDDIAEALGRTYHGTRWRATALRLRAREKPAEPPKTKTCNPPPPPWVAGRIALYAERAANGEPLFQKSEES